MKTASSLLVGWVAPHSFTLIILWVLSCTAIATADSIRTVALTGAPAPGTESGVLFNLGQARSAASELKVVVALNNTGQVAIRGSLEGVGVNPSNDVGLWSESTDGGLQLVTREGQQASGAASDVFFSSIDSFDISDTGQTTFLGEVTGTGVSSSNDHGIWTKASNSAGLTLNIREGTQAPGTATGITFNQLREFRVNNAGQVAIYAALGPAGPGVNVFNFQGIWSEGSGEGLKLVARTGTQARAQS